MSPSGSVAPPDPVTVRPLRNLHTAIAVLAVVGALAASCTSSNPTGPAPGDAALRITPLSTRAEYATNGDLLVAVGSPTGASLDDLRVELNGRDVTSAFAPDTRPPRGAESAPRLVGLVSGMSDGPNVVTAAAGVATASLDVVNHPVDGPLFSGPHQSPFVCTTQRNGLGAPVDDCWAQTTVRWVYRTTDGRTVDLPDPAVTPPDAAILTRDGRQVPFVVRIEKGVFNRSVTTFATLDPRPGPIAGTVPGPTPARVWDDSGWNGRLVVRFGGGCGATYSQGGGSPSALDPVLLAEGYAVVVSTLTTFEAACNDVVAAETVMVAKEHFSEAYGLPRFTIGIGGSGGAIQQLLIAQNYPGLLDAIGPAIPFPDAISIAGGVADCGLLRRWYDQGGATLSDDQKLAVTGFATLGTCLIWQTTFLPNIDPQVGCDRELVGAGQVYDAVTNPRGVRCTTQDSNVNLFGTDRETGFAQRPLDNVGIQYGLGALQAGTIDVDHFLDLNEGIGGYDIDGVWQASRTRAPDEVLTRAYAGGRISAGAAAAQGAQPTGGGLADVPVLLLNVYSDPIGDIHDRQRIFAIRDRLRLPDGTASPNVVLWTYPGADDLNSLITRLSGDTGFTTEAVQLLDEWLTAAEPAGPDDTATSDDAGSRSGMSERAALLSRTRPADAADRCVLPDGSVLTGPTTYDPGAPCDLAYPTHADPRRVAGAPITGTTVACTLGPVDASSGVYGVTFTPSQAQRLAKVFPVGVCDWSRPGRGQAPLDDTWRSYD